MAKAGASSSKLTRRAAIAATAATLAVPVGAAIAGAPLGLAGFVPAAGAAPAPAAPAPPDPVLAAIAAHRAALAGLEAAAAHLSAVEEGTFDDGGQERGDSADDDPVLLAAEAAFEAACETESRTAWALARVPVATPAAAAALLRHAGEVRADGAEWPAPPHGEQGFWNSNFHHSLAAALEGTTS